MSEGAPEYRATEGPANLAGPDAQDALDDAAAAAFDELLERAGELREFVCSDPLHVEVSEDFLYAAQDFASAFDAFEAAHDAVEDTAESARLAGDSLMDELPGPNPFLAAGGIASSEDWREGFRAGARSQHQATIDFAQGRGWVSVASAVMTAPLVAVPSTSAASGPFPGQSTSEGAPDVRP